MIAITIIIVDGGELDMHIKATAFAKQLKEWELKISNEVKKAIEKIQEKETKRQQKLYGTNAKITVFSREKVQPL